MTTSRLRITFVLPLLFLTGGVRVVFEHSRRLRERGHTVRILAPRLWPGAPWTASGRSALRRWVVNRYFRAGRNLLEFFGLEDCVESVPRLEDRHFPEADVIVATAWQTASPVAEAAARCGKKAYFLQHYEVFQPEFQNAVDDTWRLPLEHIVVSSWLGSLGRDRFGVASWGPVKNAVDTRIFHNRGRTPGDRPVVGMMYDLQPWKGTEDGLAAIEQARRSVPDLRVRLFGRNRLRHRLQPGDRYFRDPPQQTIGDIYRSCDLFMSPSWSEGWGLPVMEAMACGCAVAATECGGIDDFTIPGETVLTAPPRHPEMLGAQLEQLLLDPALRARIARAGTEHVRGFTWEAATDRLEDYLSRIAEGEQAGPPR